MKCFVCGQKFEPRNIKHLYECCNAESKEEKEKAKYKCLCLNFSISGEEFSRLYVENQWSIPDFYNNYGMSSKIVYFFLDFLGIEKRTISKARKTKRCIKKSEKTCQDRYGASNPLSHGTDPYRKRNQTVKEKYGVVNIFQLETVKQQITQTCLEKYGQKRVTDGNKQSVTKSNFTPEQWGEILEKKRNTISSWDEKKTEEVFSHRSTAQKQRWENMTDEEKNLFLAKALGSALVKNKLESRVASILTSHGISFVWSFFVNRRQYDFRISRKVKLILEVQGDYWHANPEIYLESDVLHHPGNKDVLASELWEKDKQKKKEAEAKGYSVIYLWEKDINRMEDSEILFFIAHQIQELIDEQNHKN